MTPEKTTTTLPEQRTDCTMTASRQSCIQNCPMRHFWCYELGIRPAKTAAPLRMGTLWHQAMEWIASLEDPQKAYPLLHQAIDEADYPDDLTRETDRHTLCNLLAGYLWRWGGTGVKVLACEEEFVMPLYHPATGEASAWQVAGKRDKRILLDGRELVMEHKTSSEDLSPESEYWTRLQMDPQISVYVLSCRMAGGAVDSVLYDVTRKPTIRLRQKETPEEFGKRLLSDIQERPDYYYARREIPRLVSDLDQARSDLWAYAELIEHFREHGHWPRNTSACNRFGRCPYWDLCANGYAAGEALPDNFVVAERTHMELSIGDSDQ